MANIQERRDKSGKLISYSIRIHRGRGPDGKQLKPWTTAFEKECREGVTSDSRRTFRNYCDYVLDLKESRVIKHSTIVRYWELATRIYPAIGHIKLKGLGADHLNSLYIALGKGVRGRYRRFYECFPTGSI